MKSKRMIACLVLCLALFFCVIGVSAEGYTGWQYDGTIEKEVWMQDGVVVTEQWVEDSGYRYYVGEDGGRYENGVYEIGGAKYLFNWNGELCIDTQYTVDIWDAEQEAYVIDGYYRAKADGTIYENEWCVEVHEPGTDWEWTNYYYYGEGGKAPSGLTVVDGQTLGFHNGGMVMTPGYYVVQNDDQTKSFVAVDEEYNAAEAQNNKWTKLSGKWYYVQNEEFCYGGLYTINGKVYGFDYDGTLYVDEIFDAYDDEAEEWNYYYAQGGAADGEIARERWISKDGYWYYFGADGKACRDDVYKINNKWYGFNWEGMMYSDEAFEINFWDEELEESVTQGIYRAAASGVLYTNTWYYDDYGNGADYRWGDWYYYGADGKAALGVATVNGKLYYFYEDGRMSNERFCVVSEGAKTYYLIIEDNGVAHEVPNNGWAKVDGKWYYVQNGDFCIDDVYTINGKPYGFNGNGELYMDELFDMYDEESGDWGYYYAQGGAADGALAKNQWIYRKQAKAWSYFGADCKMYERGIYTINGKRYAFDDNGAILTDRVVYDYENGKYYAATYMDKNGAGGSICTEKNTWKAVNGDWVYLTEDSSLFEGWFQDKYFMGPEMMYATYTADEEYNVYLVAENGVSKKLTTTGFLTAFGDTLYLENGQAVFDKLIEFGGKQYYVTEFGVVLKNQNWEIDGSFYFFNKDGVMAKNGWVDNGRGRWYYAQANGELLTEQWFVSANGKKYYFLYDGRMACDGTFDIEGTPYCFTMNGTLANGWYQDSYGDWYWADKNGKAFTGVDSAGYVFTSYGMLVEDGIYSFGDVCYVTNASGKKIATITESGWHKVGNDWYYVDDTEGALQFITYDCFYDEYGRCFFFYEDGKLRVNQFYGEWYLDGNGEAKTGWFKVDNRWYYGDPEDGGWLYSDGLYTINDKEYAFDYDGRLRQNVTFYDWGWGELITTDVNGVVVKQTAPNGWVYNETWDGQGQAFYYKGGEPYNGWLGSYYIEDGCMAINSFVFADNDKVYYLNEKGLKASAGWHELYEDGWIYVRTDGSVAYDEWLKVGGKWYYFDCETMVYDTTMMIEGDQHTFDKGGVWKGKNLFATKDGWKQYNGDWYYVMAQRAVTNKTLLINGKWYAFDDSGKMLKNAFCMDDYSYGYAYYTASGARAEYVGWQKINGKWVHFKADNTVSSWVYENGEKKYYIDVDWDSNGVKVGMVTGWQVINEKIYRFGSDGKLAETYTKQGWTTVKGVWYYVNEYGYVVAGETAYEINGAYYAFDYDGKMIANEATYDDYKFYGADGKLVTKQGWYQVSGGKWVYVCANGRAAMDGVFRINGKDYYFSRGYWVK